MDIRLYSLENQFSQSKIYFFSAELFFIPRNKPPAPRINSATQIAT